MNEQGGILQHDWTLMNMESMPLRRKGAGAIHSPMSEGVQQGAWEAEKLMRPSQSCGHESAESCLIDEQRRRKA